MNRELRRVSWLVLAMFVALFTAASIIQVGQADALYTDSRNTRAVGDQYDVQRGPILVGGRPVVQSVASKDGYKYQREYADGPLYASVTGYYAINGAATGIESALNQELAGTSNADFLSRLNDTLTGAHPQGNSVELTIDAKVQKAAYDALGGLQGAVVVEEVKTGRILALVSKPDYDPNVLAAHDTNAYLAAYHKLASAAGDPLVNKAITDLNPPGSTFKPVVSSAAIGSGAYSKSSPLPNVSSLKLPGSNTVIHNDNRTTCAGSAATVSIELAQAFSCNLPFAELGAKLGSAAVKQQAELFGFNHEFDIPMPVSKSLYPGYSDAAQLMMSAFGQIDDRATALQMAMNMATIANGGVVMNPTVVDSILAPDLTVRQAFQASQFGRAVSAATAKTETEMLVKGVEEGTGTNARISGVSVAGKTGTAQNGVDKPFTLWFTGFAPADNPQYAVSVVVENGGGMNQSGTGNAVAAPVARKVLEAVLGK